MKLSRRPLPLTLGTAGIASAAAIAIGSAQIAGNSRAATSSAGTSISRATNPYAGVHGTPGGRTWGAVPDTGGADSSDAAGTTPSTTDRMATTGTTTEARPASSWGLSTSSRR